VKKEDGEERVTAATAALEICSAPAAIAGRTACHRRPRPAALPRPPRRPALLEAPPPPVCRRPQLPSNHRLDPFVSGAGALHPHPPKLYGSPAARSSLAIAFSAAASRSVVGSGEVYLAMDGEAQALSLG
jgi:hypothetical protein